MTYREAGLVPALSVPDSRPLHLVAMPPGVQTQASSRLSAASGCLQAESGLLSAVADEACRPATRQRRMSRAARHQPPVRQPRR